VARGSGKKGADGLRGEKSFVRKIFSRKEEEAQEWLGVSFHPQRRRVGIPSLQTSLSGERTGGDGCLQVSVEGGKEKGGERHAQVRFTTLSGGKERTSLIRGILLTTGGGEH